MARLVLLLALLAVPLPAAGANAADLARLFRETGLDSEECYRVRELDLSKEDAKIYLTDGYLIFGKPVLSHRYSAVFVADVEAGDAELLVMPPTRSERYSLASSIGSPNLNEHFKAAVMIFTDDTFEVLRRAINAGEPRKSAERGVLLESKWSEVARNLAVSFEVRLVHDILSGRPHSEGMFYAAVSGNQLGNFDVLYDPLAREQIRVGKVAFRDGQPDFDIWTSFESRSFRRGLRQFPPPDVSVDNYRLDATLLPDLTLKVTTRVTIVPSGPGHRALPFDLARQMKVTEAFVDGQPAEIFQRESLRDSLIRNRMDDLILLVPPTELQAGKPYELEFRHEGAVISEAGNNVYYVGARGNWYPNRMTQFAHCEITFRYPKGLGLVAAGEVVKQQIEGDFVVTHRKIPAPIRFLGFNLGDFEKVSTAKGQYTVEVYANRRAEAALHQKPRPVLILPPRSGWPIPGESARSVITLPVEPSEPDPAARLNELAAEIASALEFMAERFGPPPLRQLTVSPIPGAFGQGFPGLLYLSTMSYLNPKERPLALDDRYRQLFFSEVLHAHETAHQWWGNIVTSASYQDDWIMEALANYSALFYLEKRKGPRAPELVLSEYRKHLLEKAPDGRTVESAGPILWGGRLRSAAAPGAWHLITYEKGSWIMHMLRRRMGDERFVGMLGELRRRYEYRTLTTAQFQMLAAEYLPPGSVDPRLSNFFEQWVESVGIPALELKYSLRGASPSVRLAGTLTQSGVSDDFGVDVPVEIHLPKGKVLTHWIRSASEPASFTLNLPAAPVRVLLDPGDSVLAVRK